MRICRRCVLPESPPDITLNADGLCSVCVQYDREHGDEKRGEAVFLETDLVKILNRHRGKHRYDCLVMCSGGKDSTSALYYMVKRYRLNVLAFMFDHGFETEDAVANVKRAVEVLGTDFITFKSDYMKEMFAKLVRTGSRAVICHLCSIWYMQLTYDLAARYDVPLIVAGWTKGQSIKQPVMSKCACSVTAPEYRSMAEATREFMRDHVRPDPRYRDFPESMEAVVVAAKKRHKCMVISPHWFLPVNQEEYVQAISRELGWRLPRLSYPRNSTNCYLNFLSVHNSLKHYGYTHYHVEMSKMIREGQMTREQALRDLEVFFGTDLLDEIGGRLGCSSDGNGEAG